MAGWHGVDLDGTLAHYLPGDGVASIGAPIPRMVERILDWLERGEEVRIVTARVGACNAVNSEGIGDSAVFAGLQRVMIEDWCLEHIGHKLPVVCSKDFQMIDLWDDRAIQVGQNTGKPVAHYAHEAGYRLGLEHGRNDTTGQAEGHYNRGYAAGIASVLDRQNIHLDD